jgi:hypothetical protein
MDLSCFFVYKSEISPFAARVFLLTFIKLNVVLPN